MWMLVIEVILTVVAWLRGWKWWALLPLGLGVGGAFLAGFVLYSVGPATVPTWSLILGGMFDVLAMLALVVMAIVGRKRVEDWRRKRAGEEVARDQSSGDGP